MARYASSTAAMDEAERAWWEENGDLEERYCWVQEPRHQRLVRRRYVELIAEHVPDGSRVLEMGCGTGWLSLLLARRRRSTIVGWDWSPDQVGRARAAAAAAGLHDRVSFAVAGAGGDVDEEDGGFDVVIMHAFLHHLSTGEADEAIAVAAARLVPGGRLLVMEPLHFSTGPHREPLSLRALRKLEALPRALAHHGLRRVSGAERDVRDRLAARQVGSAPFGPAPKEVPFEPSELRALLEARFDVTDTSPALSMAHLVAQELLLASLSQPRLWRVLERPCLLLAAALDRRLLAVGDLPATIWVFHLYACRKRPA